MKRLLLGCLWCLGMRSSTSLVSWVTGLQTNLTIPRRRRPLLLKNCWRGCKITVLRWFILVDVNNQRDFCQIHLKRNICVDTTGWNRFTGTRNVNFSSSTNKRLCHQEEYYFGLNFVSSSGFCHWRVNQKQWPCLRSDICPRQCSPCSTCTGTDLTSETNTQH